MSFSAGATTMIRRALTAVVLSTTAFASSQPVAIAQDKCDCEVQRPPVLATVNGTNIATADIEADTADFALPLRARMSNMREKALQSMITNRLIEVEAARRGISVPKLIKDDVIAKADEPTEAEIQTFYSRNQASIPGPYEQVKEQVRAFMRGQRQEVQMTILTTDLRSSAKIEVLEYSPPAPETEADLARVLAIVNGSKITSGELEMQLRSVMYDLRHSVWELESMAVERRIDNVLVEQEAKRRGIAPDALFNAEIAPKVKKIDAFEAGKFYNENKEKFGGRPLSEVREDLLDVLQRRERANAVHDFANALRKTASIKIALVEPAPPTFSVDLPGRPAMGAASSPVTVVVFSDFQCPKCSKAHEALAEIAKEYAGKVRIVARSFPLEQHENAYKAAVAAEAAFDQGKYWEYADLLFANQADLSVPKLKELATKAGLDRAKFDAGLEEKRFSDAVDRDLTDGTRVGVNGTPAIYVNGRPLLDDSPEALKEAVASALKKG